MDSKGRATDNAFIETLWKSIKYEKIYLNPPEDGLQLYRLVNEYFEYYNLKRGHSSIDDNTPSDVYNAAAWVTNILTQSVRKKKEAKKKEIYDDYKLIY